MPFAREDLDSNFVSMGEEFIVGDQEGASAPDIGRRQPESRSMLYSSTLERFVQGNSVTGQQPPQATSIFPYSWLEFMPSFNGGRKIPLH
jgi:hypothetical protein